MNSDAKVDPAKLVSHLEAQGKVPPDVADALDYYRACLVAERRAVEHVIYLARARGLLR